MRRIFALLMLTTALGLAGLFGAGGCGGTQNANPEAPQIIGTNPENGAVGVALNSKIFVMFNEEVDPATLTDQTFVLSDGSNIVAGVISPDGYKVSFAAGSDLAPDTAFMVTLTSSIKSMKGVPLGSDYSWGFTTGSRSDIIGPQVVSTEPAADDNEADPVTAIRATFDEALDPATVSADTFVVEDQNGAIAGAVTLSDENKTAIFTPSSYLTRGAAYFAKLTTGIADANGNPMASDHSWGFTADPAFYVSVSGNDSNFGSKGSPWRSIQYAVDNVSADDEIKVGAGNYSESSTIKIDKSLFLTGEGRDVTFIDPPANIGVQYPDQTIIDVAGSNDNAPENITVTIEGFTLDAKETANLKFVLLLRGGAYAIIRDNIIKGAMPAAGDVNSGDLAVGWRDFGYKAHALIENNLITDFHSFGIAAYGEGNVATMRGNTITGNPAMHICSSSPGTYAGAMGIVIQAGAIATITNNTITDVSRNPTCPPASYDSAIELYWAGDLIVTSNVIANNDYGFGSYNAYGPNGALFMDGNEISTNQIGVQFGNITVSSFKNNDVTGNATFGVRNNMAGVVDVRNNWWGSVTGPTNPGNPGGTGDAATGNVNFNPWSMAP